MEIVARTPSGARFCSLLFRLICTFLHVWMFFSSVVKTMVTYGDQMESAMVYLLVASRTIEQEDAFSCVTVTLSTVGCEVMKP
jgi:hypothetical protein